jgi:hypothetical protein
MAEQTLARRRGWLVAPIALAVIAFCEGPGWYLYAVYFVSGNAIPDVWVLALSVWLGWLWIASFIAALVAYRWKALWLLVAAPFALAWPAAWVYVAFPSCDPIGACLAFADLSRDGE